MAAQRHDPATWPAHIAEQQLQDGRGADVLHARRVLRPADRVHPCRGLVAAAAADQRARQRGKLVRTYAADPLHEVGGVPGEMPLQHLEDAARMAECRVTLTRRLPAGIVICPGQRVVSGEQPLAFLGVDEVLGQDVGGVGVRGHVVAELVAARQHVVDKRTQQHDVAASPVRYVHGGQCAGPGEPRIDVDDRGTACLGLDHPLERDRMAFGHI